MHGKYQKIIEIKHIRIKITNMNIIISVNNTNDLCLSSYCVKAGQYSFESNEYYSTFIANYLLESIDETVDPCENFYKFTCGTWIKNAKIPEDGNLYYRIS